MEESSGEVLGVWFEDQFEENIIILSQEDEKSYYITSYHIDALDPNWDNLNISCVSEIYFSIEIFNKIYECIAHKGNGLFNVKEHHKNICSKLFRIEKRQSKMLKQLGGGGNNEK
jgi:hypothetical protein